MGNWFNKLIFFKRRGKASKNASKRARGKRGKASTDRRIMSRLIEGLPDELSLMCLARVPLHLYPKLELVSHSWLEAIRSTKLFKARQEVKSTEEFICVFAEEPEEPYRLWQLYDPRHDHWITLPHLPTISPLRFGTASVAGKLFVLGGTCVSNHTDEVWSYNPITRRWVPCAKMSLPRYNFACCVLDGKIIVAGGRNNFEWISKVEIYDPEKDQWLSLPDLPHTYKSQCQGFVIGGKVHILHEEQSTVQVLENIKQGWTVHDRWLQKQGWRDQRDHGCHRLEGPVMTVLKEKLYIMCHGVIFDPEKRYRLLYSATREFDERAGFAMIGLGDDIYVIGGVDPEYDWGNEQFLMSCVYVLMLGNGKVVWQKVSTMTLCRGRVHGCTLLRI